MPASPSADSPDSPDSPDSRPTMTGIRHVLLDIEGTTCPVRFVSGTLFPYAAAHLAPFLSSHAADAAVLDLVAQVEEAWTGDSDPAARSLREAAGHDGNPVLRVIPYLRWLIQQDRKLTPLKELQGLIWDAGYHSGELVGPLYADVAPALRLWHSAGLGLAVYSSGSVAAQQLIYGCSNAGDLRPLFTHWFDTRIGSKLEPASYQRILESLGATAEQVLFISDSPGELAAARAAGLPVLLSDRPEDGVDPQAGRGFTRIQSFSELDPRELNVT